MSDHTKWQHDQLGPGGSCSECLATIVTLRAALREACDLASPFTMKRAAAMTTGYASEMRPMFTRIGDINVDDRIALRALAGGDHGDGQFSTQAGDSVPERPDHAARKP